jgi:FKBP-type peptidyl-prolyl cis-trans isomerase
MNKSYFFVGIFLALLIVTAGVYLFKTGSAFSNQSLETPSPSASIKSPVPTADKEDMKEGNQDQLEIQDLTVGSGAEAVAGKKITVNYTGTLTDGTKFDSSYDHGTPFSFNLGAGEVIKGWDEGVVGMKVGGKRKLTIPSSLAYGEQGIPGAIPGGATLVFEVELLKVE